MESDKNNFKDYGYSYKKKKKFNKKALIFFGFLFVIGIIIFTILYSNSSITGNVISSVNPDNSIIISSELTIPNLNFKGEYSEIKILSNSMTTIYLGEKSFILDDSKENRIILKEFSGKIKLEEDGVLLDGKVSEATLNNLPIKEKNNKKIKIYSDSKIPYNFIKFKENMFLKEINYVSSGILSIGEDNQDKIILDDDSLLISNYFGKLKIDDDILFLEGFAGDIKISGEMKKISISK